MNPQPLKELLREASPRFWDELFALASSAVSLDELILLSAFRKKAITRGLERPTETQGPGPLRLALLGGCTFHPLQELIELLLDAAGIPCVCHLGDYDNYIAEIHDSSGELYSFGPQVVLLVPSLQRCRYTGSLVDPRERIQREIQECAGQLLGLCQTLHETSRAEVLLANYPLPARRDPGAFRSRTLASDWSFRKAVNLELGLAAPSFVHVCDVEFLSSQLGLEAAEDARGWFETKQPGSPMLLVELAREVVRMIGNLRKPPRKVLVLDLDNTLWGGVVAEDGLDHIEIGATSPRGEAYRAFQHAIRSLKERGVLLAVCSKNDEANALEVFQRHPEMVLRRDDFVGFKANWLPKSDNLRQLAEELSLGLDSFVFVDDSPGEIEVVRQFTPAVQTLLLGPDPSGFVAQLLDAGWFDPRSITGEDLERSRQYQAEAARREGMGSAADMGSYLRSLEMVGEIGRIRSVDVARVTQLINKSNQFNLTTRRRTEAEVSALSTRPDCLALAVRLRDRFGDHGLIGVVIGWVEGTTLRIDTWLMSCRVLKRQVEETVLNEVVREAISLGCLSLQGEFRATPKNEMVRDFYPRMGFSPVRVTPESGEYRLDLHSFQPHSTAIRLEAQSPSHSHGLH